jgi:hypothetical protein
VRQRNGVIAALVLVVLGAGLWLLLGRGPSGTDKAGAHGADAGPVDALALRKAARRRGDRDRTPAALSGIVRDAASNAGLGGAVVTLEPAGLFGDRAATPGLRPPPLYAHADPSGAYRIDRVPPGRYRASATATAHLPGATLDLVIVAGTPRTLDFALTQGGALLSGTVTDVGGGAVAQAVVSATRIDGGDWLGLDRAAAGTLTDEAGHYQLNLAEGHYAVAVRQVDYVDALEQVEVRGGPRVLDIVLTPAAAITGVVLTRGERKPVAGAIVTTAGGRATGQTFGLAEVKKYLGFDAVVTDSDGRFALRGLGAGVIEVTALHGDGRSREPTVVELGVAEQKDGILVLIDPAYSISGFVVRANKPEEGVGNAMVAGLAMKGEIRPTFVVETDETGYFEIPGVAPGTYTMGALRNGAMPNFLRVNVTVKDKDVSDVLLSLDAGATLRGRIEPAGLASLALSMRTDDMGLGTMFSAVGAALVQGRTKDDGTFELPAVPSGEWTLVARGDDGARGELPVRVTSDDQAGLVVKMVPKGSIAGAVVDENGAPVTNAEVAMDLRDRGQRDTIDFGSAFGGRVSTDTSGRFVLRGLIAGTYTPEVDVNDEDAEWASGEAPAPISLAEGEAKTGVVLKIEARNGTIRGRVVSADGKPLPDAWVVARGTWNDELEAAREDDEPAPKGEQGGKDTGKGKGGGARVEVRAQDDDAPTESWGPTSKPALTDSDGRFALKGLGPKNLYTVTADGPGGRAHRQKVKPGSDIVLTIKPFGRLEGKVTTSGAAVTDFRIELRGPVRKSSHVLDDQGRYLIERLDAGEYEVTVTSDGGAVKKRVRVAAGQTATLDLSLEPWGQVRGRVVDALTGEPISGARVAAFSHELGAPEEMGMSFLTGGGPTTDRDGKFSVGKLGPGKAQVVVFEAGLFAGFEPLVSREVVLAVGEQKDLGELRALTKARVKEKERGDLGLSTTTGEAWLNVTAVASGGAADKAGVKVGDQILAIDQNLVTTTGTDAAMELLDGGRVKVGQEVRLGLRRKDEALELGVTATARDGKK